MKNPNQYRDYSDMAQDMLNGLKKGELPHVGDLVYMHDFNPNGPGRDQARQVMDAIIEDPELTEKFDIKVAAHFDAVGNFS